jgi:hypothetical protein
LLSNEAAVSSFTSLAGLSSRSPRKVGCRSKPSLVISVNRTSATSSGLTQVTPRASAPRGGSASGGLDVWSGFSFSASSESDASLKPVPTRPA